MEFRLLSIDGAARQGILSCNGISVETPCFMPVATQGAVKGVTWDRILQMGYSLVLMNLYHLYLRPGIDAIESAGGIHRFAGWDGCILTDSGGFQIFSLGELVKVTDDGAYFRSHVDGSLHFLSPELVVEYEERIGVDIGMVLDECVPYPTSRDYAERAVERTFKWAERSLKVRKSARTAVFGIVQGSVYDDLRERSVRLMVDFPFEGFAIGGVSVGEPKQDMYRVVSLACSGLPFDKPRYLMGVGKPEDIVFAVGQGVDLFDCVIPTRNARNGTLFTWGGKLVIKNSRYKNDYRPVDPDCSCYTCRHFSRAYLRHLFLSGEVNAIVLNTIHNLHFYNSLMVAMRNAISSGIFEDFKKEFAERYQIGADFNIIQ